MLTIKLLMMVSLLFGNSALCRSESQRMHADRQDEYSAQRQHTLLEPRSLADTHEGTTRVARRIAERLQRLDERIRDNTRTSRDTDERTLDAKNVRVDGRNRRDVDDKMERYITVALIIEALGNHQTFEDKRRFKKSRHERFRVRHDEESETNNRRETDVDEKQEDDERVEERGSDDSERDRSDDAVEDLWDEDGNVIERYKKNNDNEEQEDEAYENLENGEDNANGVQGDYASYQEIDTKDSVDQKLCEEDGIQGDDDTEHLNENKEHDKKEKPGNCDDTADKEQDDKGNKIETNCHCGFWKRFGEDVAFSIQENVIPLSLTLLYFFILLCFCPIMARCLSATIADVTFFCCFVFPVMWLNLLLMIPRWP